MYRWLLLLLLSCSTGYSQTNTDSILNELKKSLSDSSSTDEYIYYSIGQVYYGRGIYDSATFFYLKALKLYQNQEDTLGIASLSNNLGVTYSKLGYTDSCLYYYKHALSSYRKANDTLNIGSIQLNIGIVFKNQGQYEEAMDKTLSAAKILGFYKNTSQLAACYNTIASLYSKQHDYDKAISYHQKALSIRQHLNLANGISSSLNNIGTIYSKLNNYDSALSYYLRSLELKKQLSNQKKVASTLNNIGLIQIKLKKYSKAETYLKEALTIRSTSIDKSGEAAVMNNLGRLYNEMGQERKALQYLEKAYLILNELGLLEEKKENLELKLTAFQKLNQVDKALITAQHLLVIKDSLLNRDKVQSLIEMQTKYETEKKEQSITLLEQEKSLQAAQIELDRLWITLLIISAVLILIIALFIFSRWKDEKRNKRKIETLMQELHHRVKNNLQLLSSIFSLQSRFLKDKNALEAAKSGENRVNAMTIIHQALYADIGVRTVNIKKYINNLIEELATSYGQSIDEKAINVDVQDFEIDVDQIIPVGLIVNELVSNVFKYVFPTVNGAKLSVSISHQGNNFHMEIKDNGSGFDATQKAKKSMGLNIVETLCRQLEAEVTWTTSDMVKFNMKMTLK